MADNTKVVDVILSTNLVEVDTNPKDSVEIVSLGPQGPAGPTGYTYTPSVDSTGTLTWTNNGNLDNPESYSFMTPVNAVLQNYVTKSSYNSDTTQSLSVLDLYKILV